jgi:hypothetical protein
MAGSKACSNPIALFPQHAVHGRAGQHAAIMGAAVFREFDADAVALELDIEQRRIGDREIAGDIIPAGQRRVHQGIALLRDLPPARLDRVVVGFGKAQRQDWSTTSAVVASTCWPKRS